MKFNKAYEVMSKNLRREPLFAAGSILVVTLTFLTLNLFAFIIASSNVVLEFLESKAQINVFFLDSIKEDQILKLKTSLESDSRVASVHYTSKEDALKIFIEREKNEPVLLEAVKTSNTSETNPLPASLEIKANNIGDLQVLSDDFSKLEGVQDVKFYKDVVDTFTRWSGALKIAGAVVLVVFTFISILMILVTIGATINSKGTEVEILRLVGASEKYVKAPLVLQGVFYGVVAALLSSLLIFATLPILLPTIKWVFSGIPMKGAWWVTALWSPLFGSGIESWLHRGVVLVLVLFAELVFGAGLGFIGSTLAIRKYLKY